MATIPSQFPGKLVKRAFEFCQYYKKNPFKEVKHRLDNYKGFNNFYNTLLDDLCSRDIICFLRLADYLNIPQLLQVICYKVAYLMRDISPAERLQFFALNNQWLTGYADM